MPLSSGDAEQSVSIPVLFIHHSGALSGATRSLIELIRGFPGNSVTPYVVTPHGVSSELIAETGAKILETAGISQIDNTQFGYYRGKRWLLLLREITNLPATLNALLRARRRWPSIRLVHVNEITALPAALIAKLVFRVPVIVHVRSVQRSNRSGLLGKLVGKLLQSQVDALIAIDGTVRRSLSHDLHSHIVHNSFFPAKEPADDERWRFGGAGHKKLRVGFVGSLLPLKGIFEFLEAARICSEYSMNIEFLIAGGNPRPMTGAKGWIFQTSGFASDCESRIEAYISRHNLGGNVRMLGIVRDVSVVYRNLDLLCFPSHLDAVGRPVFEAAFWKIPSVVAIRDPEPDTFIPGQTGLHVPAGDSKAIAAAIQYFYHKPTELMRMGEAALQLALTNFNSTKNAAKVLRIYKDLLQEPA